MDNRTDVNQAISERQASIQRNARKARANQSSAPVPHPPSRRKGLRARSGRQLIRLGERLVGERQPSASSFATASAR